MAELLRVPPRERVARHEPESDSAWAWQVVYPSRNPTKK